MTNGSSSKQPDRARGGRRGRRLLRDVAVAAVGVGVGLGAVAVWQHRDAGAPALRTDERASVASLPFPVPAPDPARGPTATDPATVAPPVGDPAAALAAFLEAEAHDDFGRSYALLAAEDRERFPTAARWEDAHHALPQVTGAGPIEQTGESAGRVTFRVGLALQPRLDESIGVVPARATASFVALPAREGDWRVAFSESSLTPEYPDAGGARAAAAAWAEARQRCESTGEWEGGLLGVAAEAHAASLCHTTAAVLTGEPISLDRATGTEPVLAAFGPDASIWARVVRVSGPVELDVVTAPLGEGWVVVGVLQASTGGSPEPP